MNCIRQKKLLTLWDTQQNIIMMEMEIRQRR